MLSPAFLMGSFGHSHEEPSGQGLSSRPDRESVFDHIFGAGLDNVVYDTIYAFGIREGIVRRSADDDVCIGDGRSPEITGKHIVFTSSKTINVVLATLFYNNVIPRMDGRRDHDLIQTLGLKEAIDQVGQYRSTTEGH